MAASPHLLFLVGCTGCGKGALGRELARRSGGEIISLDSMKVYRRMDIGTAKPNAEQQRQIRHHLLDVVEPSADFSVAQYVALGEAAIHDIHSRGRPIFVVGGTPLYLKALTEGLFEGPGAQPDIRRELHDLADREGSAELHRRLVAVDPDAAQRIHPNDLRRLVRALEVYALTGTPITALQRQWDRDHRRHDYTLSRLRRELPDQNHRTNERVLKMMASGFLEEVRSLGRETPPLSRTASQALGYAEILNHLRGQCTLAEAVESIKINTRRFAKAQRTWLNRFRQAEVIDLSPDASVEAVADDIERRWGHLWSA
jgi:tRNA dimethylallyltransferase